MSKARRNLAVVIFVAALCALFLLYERHSEKISEPASAPDSSTEPRAKESPETAPPNSTATVAVEPPASTAKEMTPEQMYCYLQKANVGIPLTGKLKILNSSYASDDEGKPGIWAWVQSSDCPANTFSIVEFDPAGHLKKMVDCRRANREQIVTSAGIQGEIKDTVQKPDEIKVAIRGPGFFVITCGGRFFLSRSGEFQIVKGRILQNSCPVLGKDGLPFDPKGEELVDETGCTAHGACLAIVLPTDPNALEYQDRLTLLAKSDPFRYPVLSRQVVRHSLENFDDPRIGPLGPDWAKYPDIKSTQCDGF